MLRLTICGVLLATCGGEHRGRGAGSAPAGTVTTTGRSNLAARGASNRDRDIRADPASPESNTSGRR